MENKKRIVIVRTVEKGTKPVAPVRKSPETARVQIPARKSSEMAREQIRPRRVIRGESTLNNVVQTVTTINEQPRNIYKSDKVKRLGQIEKVYQRYRGADLALILSEIESGDEIRGYIKEEDGEEYGIEWIEGDELDDYFGSWYADSDMFVFYEKRTNQDGSRSKAGWISPVRLENKADLERLEKSIRFYRESNPLYEKYRQMLEKRFDSGNVDPNEIFTLISAGTHDKRGNACMLKHTLKYLLDDHIISEDEARELLDLLLQEDIHTDTVRLFGDRFLEYESYLLSNYNHRKELFYAKDINVENVVKNSDRDTILKFIEEYLNAGDDDMRIRRLVEYLDEDLLLTYPEYERFASAGQVSVLEALRQEGREKDKIREIIQRRNIRYFIHFTNVDNIRGILDNGILTLDQLGERGISYRNTDDGRWDIRHRIAGQGPICLTVDFPNCEMFWRKRKNLADVKWCILLLDPVKVIKRRCRYFPHNAATNELQREDRGFDTADDFEHMFAETERGIGDFVYRRSELFDTQEGNEGYTTSPQAEIQCFEEISVDCIDKCIFQEESTLNEYADRLEEAGIPAETDPWFFGYGPYNGLGELRRAQAEEELMSEDMVD